MTSSPAVPPTELVYQLDGRLLSLPTVVLSIRPLADIEDANRQLFAKQIPDSGSSSSSSSKEGGGSESSSSSSPWYVVVTEKTIFHPQGGGQPADEGTIESVPMAVTGAAAAPAAPGDDGDDDDDDKGRAAEATSPAPLFRVSAVRKDALGAGHVLHLGRFESAPPPPSPLPPPDPAGGSGHDGSVRFQPGQRVVQRVDAAARLLHSRWHTAGHVLGSAVRDLVQHEIAGFDEVKASHFPGQASCEFRGLIDGARWRAPIQARVDEYVARAMPVEIDWWDEDDFRREGLERLIPTDPALLELVGAGISGEGGGGDGGDGGKKKKKGKFRVVRIVGAEVYPCGGTHVESTDLCGQTTVKKISRSKGISRVSYIL